MGLVLAPERQRLLLRILAEQGRLTINEASSRLAVSLPTIRRDFVALAASGFARRAHGALLPVDFGLVEPKYTRKAEKAVAAKVRLGRAAAALLPEQGNLFVDAGTTCLEVGRVLIERPGLRIHTNSIPLLALASEARATLIALGGEVRPLSLALTGALTQHWLENLRFDAAVIGASGLDAASGASTTELGEAAVKTEALRRSRRRILIALGDKWNQPAALRFAPWDAFSDLVTDHPFSRAERLALSRNGLRLHAPAIR
ncbi:DeoR/GlpR family DNA-binding transcription regulator [Rariglobus hedericola]|uniref:DeoR/GlpR transcriptional regulator n=1 Tax=Rariglobus hedericola TaxID=2597822 RepID=A0A556QSK9_9BACT|nr:DeoR/GlpR family DNA-binding transcription regulator [Rariglobus hedericola]TSJ79612.1 DeoR/GlpR transcriptional regulator [Rariglobus hedericola]